MKGDPEQVIRAGAEYYLSKPFDIRELKKLVEKCLSALPTKDREAGLTGHETP
jgi:DNA-binding response OmpR family regulator